MIDFELLEINTVDDYDRLVDKLKNIFPNAVHETLIIELKQRVGPSCEMIVVEFPYRDYDFSSVYSSFYAKKHQSVSRECARLHLFSSHEIVQKSYIGYVVVRDSLVDSRGRAILEPKFLKTTAKAYVVKSEMKAHIAGMPLKINTFPWMAQDTDISICAHIAVWSIVNYYANKYPNYKISSIGEISEKTPHYLGRKTPSEGLNLLQVSELLSINGFYPLVLRKRSNNDSDFFRALYAYIESGIPMVAAMTQKEHAVAIIGHGEFDMAKLKASHDRIIYIADYLSDFIISDDNVFPFTSITRSGGSYTFDDLDYVIVPLYEKMYLNANIVYKRVEGLITTNVLNIPGVIVLRVYLTSIRSLKREALKNSSMNEILKSTLIKLPAPQFVWCADICIKDEYNDQLTSARIIIDSTAGTYENDPWLLMHDKEKIIFKDGQNINRIDVQIDSYDMYKNNLKEA